MIRMKEKKSYEIIIAPSRGWDAIDWLSLWHYRDLLYFLVRREFISKYKQTILGPLWFILQPLLTTGVFTVIFGKLARIPTDTIPPILFYMCGLLAWSYFAQCLNGVSVSLSGNTYILDKVYFPRLIIPLSIICSNFFAFCLQLAVFLIFYTHFKFFTPAGALMDVRMFILWLPLLFLQTAAVALGVGLWIAAFTVKYRDFRHLMDFLTLLWMYATPIVYPISMIPGRWKILIALNPMTGIVESYRYAFFGVGTVDPEYLLISGAVTLVVLMSGVLFFSKIEKTCVDVL